MLHYYFIEKIPSTFIKKEWFSDKVGEVLRLLEIRWCYIFHVISTNVWKHELEEIRVFIVWFWFTMCQFLDFKRNVINNFYLHTHFKIASTDDVDLFHKLCWCYDILKKILIFFTERYTGNPSLLDISVGFLLDWSQVSSCCEI